MSYIFLHPARAAVTPDPTTPPLGPEARLARVAGEALGTGLLAWRRAVEQAPPDQAQPFVLAVVPDCEAGLDLLVRKFGLRAAMAACGPMVWTVPAGEVAALMGAGRMRAELEKLAPQPGDVLWLFAVNGAGLELRAMRAAAPAGPSVVEEPTAP